MVSKVVDGLGAAIGCRFLRNRNQLVFVEYSKGAISLLEMICPVQSVVSQGTIVLKGTWVFDCETGALGGGLGGPGDIWWEQIDNVKRQMVPVGSAGIVNLGKANFGAVTPAVLQTLSFSNTPIPGNNDPSNQLVNGDVFAVRTKAGNLAKILVVNYGYDLTIQWVTYKLASPYHQIGTGYHTPEDIAVCADEKTAYVTERTGDLLKVDLSNANRAAAAVVASGMNAPQQIHLDEVHHQAYVVEYANPGRLVRIDLTTGQQTVLLTGLNNAIGLLISSDLADAYISEQSGGGRISRYSLAGGGQQVIASGLTNPFFLTWASGSQSTIYVAERDPANRITSVQTVPYAGSVQHLVSNVGARPSSVACVDSGHLLVCCDQEIDRADLPAAAVTGLFKGIGLVPWNLIIAGKADTTTQPTYPYQFPKNSPFGGVLSLQINHLLAWQTGGVQYYRVLVDGQERLETWWDLELNTANGKYEIPVQFKPQDIGVKHGFYPIRQPGHWYMNPDLGMVLNSALLANGKRPFEVQFTDGGGNVVQKHVLDVVVDNRPCVAKIEMPTAAGQPASPACGMLKFTAKTDKVKIIYTASHPVLFATYGFWIVRGANGIYSTSGNVSLNPFSFEDQVGNLLGTCPAAAFAAELSVWATMINGYGRQSQYDAYATVAFALTP
jgi:hypothetical protein